MGILRALTERGKITRDTRGSVAEPQKLTGYVDDSATKHRHSTQDHFLRMWPATTKDRQPGPPRSDCGDGPGPRGADSSGHKQRSGTREPAPRTRAPFDRRHGWRPMLFMLRSLPVARAIARNPGMIPPPSSLCRGASQHFYSMCGHGWGRARAAAMSRWRPGPRAGRPGIGALQCRAT